MRKALLVLKKIFLYTVLIVVCFEVALWILAYRPYQNVDYKVESQPGNAFLGDSLLGIQLNPGTYAITLNDSVHFTTTHLDNGQRKVPSDNPDSAITTGQTIHFFGCSFTYGYGVDDDETFAALTQKFFREKQVYNHAVSGYGTIHSTLQINEMDELKADDLVLLCFSSYHFMRNSLSQEYRSRLKIGFENSSQNLKKNMDVARFPSLQNCDQEIEFVHWKDMYENWTGRETFASVNFFQSMWDRYQDGKVDQIALTECLIEEMAAKCKLHNAKFGIICLDQDKRTVNLQKRIPHIPWLDIQFDFGNPDLTNLPYDSHPNALGHQFIHQKSRAFVKELIVK